MTLLIEHTETEGTLLDGTSRGDGSAEVVKSLGWRWSRELGMWFVPRSQGSLPKRDLIQRSAEALRRAGFEVEVSIDASLADRAALEAGRAARAADRATRLSARADREERAGEARYEAGKELADRIPFGQPILVGHHSQRRAERDRDRIHGHMDASVQHQRRADELHAAARAAAAAAGARNNPVTVANRIERISAEVRRQERALAHAETTGNEQWRERVQERLAADRADLDYWRTVREQQVADGTATNHGPDTVTAGDAVKISGTWRRVVRANPKSVTVSTDFGTDRAPWHKVTDHRAANQ